MRGGGAVLVLTAMLTVVGCARPAPPAPPVSVAPVTIDALGPLPAPADRRDVSDLATRPCDLLAPGLVASLHATVRPRGGNSLPGDTTCVGQWSSPAGVDHDVEILTYTDPNEQGGDRFAGALGEYPGGGSIGSPWVPYRVGGFPAMAQGRDLPAGGVSNHAVFLIRPVVGQTVEISVEYMPGRAGDTARFVTDLAAAVGTTLRDRPA